MAIVTVRRPGAVPPQIGGGLELSSGTTTVTLPLLPDDVDFGDLSDAWDEQPRPGRDPLLVRGGKRLKTLRFDAELRTSTRTSVVAVIERLQALAVGSTPVTVRLGGRTRGVYRIVELSCPELAWDGLGQPIEARAIVAMTEASDVPKRKGPVK